MGESTRSCAPAQCKRRRRVSLTVAVVAVLLVLAVSTATPAHAIEGLVVDADTTYRVEPAARRVRVHVTAHLTNTLPSQTQGAYIRTPYFDYFAIPVIGEVTNIRARSDVGGELSARVETEHGLSAIVVDLSPNLVHGTPQSVTVEFDLPGQKPRSRSVTRVNEGFASWFVFGAGDPGKIDMTVEVPQSFELSLSKNLPVAESTSRGRRVFRMRGVRKIDHTAFFAAALDDARLSVRTLDVAGTGVTLKAWPDDVRWQRFTARWLRRGLPALQDLVGLEPPKDKLTVLESSRTYHHGYAGVYVPELGTIEVGDVLDESVLLHELSHMWFNDDLFVSRWIGEGLAEVVSNRAVEQLGKKPRRPKPIRSHGTGAVPLNEWSAPDLLDPPHPRSEAFGYNAAHAVVHQIVEEIGVDGLREVLAAASQGRPAYAVPDGDDETTTVRDWRYFYDLVEQQAQSDDGARAIWLLFHDHVLDDYEAGLLRSRGYAKEGFDHLVGVGKGWMPPLQLRRDMGNWSFENIDHRFGEAETLLRRARTVVRRFDAAGIDAERRLQREYEAAFSLRELERTLDRYDGAADDVGAFREDVAAADPVTRVGLIGADMELAAVQRAIDDGAVHDVVDLLQAESAAVDDALGRGAAILVAALLLCTLLVAHAVRWLRIRRRADA